MTEKKPESITRDKSAKRRRELIVHTAIECFAHRGFHQTSIRDIATKAEISLGSLYNHFKSKEALIEEIAHIESHELAVLETLLTATTEPEKGIYRFVDAYLKEVSDPLYAVLSIEIAAEAMRNPKVAKAFDANRLKIGKALENTLKDGLNQKVFDAQMDIKEVANLIIEAIEGTGSRAALSSRKVSSKEKKALKWNIRKVINI